VKTSILILDKSLARQCNTIAFFKVENDGFGLGAQRRAIGKNDLPQVQSELAAYLYALRSKSSIESILSITSTTQIVPKEKIATNGDYNLSGERYREGVVRTGQRWRTVPLSEVCLLQRGLSYSTAEIGDEGHGVPFYNLKSIKRQGVPQQNDFKYFTGEMKDRHLVKSGDVLIALTDLTPTSELIGSPKLITDPTTAAYSADLGKLVFKDTTTHPQFLYHLLRSNQYREYIVTYSHGANVKHLQSDGFYAFQIPLPPLSIQQEIVAEIDGYQKVINGARAVLDNYRPHIPIHPDWPMVELGDSSLFRVESGGTPKSDVAEYWSGGIPWATLVDLPATDFISEITATKRTISDQGLRESSAKMIPANSIVVSTRATIGRIAINRIPIATNQGFKNVVIKDSERAVPKYVALAITKIVPTMQAWATGGTFAELSKTKFCELTIPLPPLATQQAIVAEIEAEQALVAANRELITRFEHKIQSTLSRIWGEDETNPAETRS
jgi:type I restriction enzyme M protein